MDTELLGNVVNFLFVALVFMVVIGVTFKVSLSKFDIKTSKIKFYGLFLGMNNKSVLAFSCITLNYIFLIWCTATFTGLNYIYVAITTIFVVLADILIKNKKFWLDLIYTAINCGCLVVASLIYNYLVNEYTTIFLLIILGLVIVFVFLYYTYITFKMLNNIVLTQENLKKKKYSNL